MSLTATLLAAKDIADVSNRIDRAQDPAEDVTITYDDPELAIPDRFPSRSFAAGPGGR